MKKKRNKYKEKDNFLLKLNNFYKEVINGEGLLVDSNKEIKIKKSK